MYFAPKKIHPTWLSPLEQLHITEERRSTHQGQVKLSKSTPNIPAKPMDPISLALGASSVVIAALSISYIFQRLGRLRRNTGYIVNWKQRVVLLREYAYADKVLELADSANFTVDIDLKYVLECAFYEAGALLVRILEHRGPTSVAEHDVVNTEICALVEKLAIARYRLARSLKIDRNVREGIDEWKDFEICRPLQQSYKATLDVLIPRSWQDVIHAHPRWRWVRDNITDGALVRRPSQNPRRFLRSATSWRDEESRPVQHDTLDNPISEDGTVLFGLAHYEVEGFMVDATNGAHEDEGRFPRYSSVLGSPDQTPDLVAEDIPETPKNQQPENSPQPPHLWHSVCYHVHITFGFFTAISLTFGITWTIARDDIQGGFTVAAYIITLGALAIAVLMGKHSEACVFATVERVGAGTRREAIAMQRLPLA